MSLEPCPRLWEVEAERDGRLSGNDLASALRHRAQCAECTSECRQLDELGARILALPAPPTDALALRRTRQRLLAARNQDVVGDAPRRTAWVLGFGGVVLLGALLIGLSLRRTGESIVNVDARPGARWAERRTPSAYHVELSNGSAWFTVRSNRQQPVFIDLPDGSIEDRGTVFEVEVSALRTARIAVREGRVLVRLHGAPSFELAAGQIWTAPSMATPPIVRAEPPVAPAPSASVTVRTPHLRVPGTTSSARGFDSAEDDAYLRIVDLLRNGHTTEASAQAKQYLARFPNGFRRLEVSEIAARSTPAQ